MVSKRGKNPKVLEERLLINNEDKNVLKAIKDLSPFDTGNLYVVGNDQLREIPTISQIAQKTNIPEEKTKEIIENIRQKWNIPEPENLPTSLGAYDKEDALINAIHNQDKLRWNQETGKYRVPKIHYFNSELGLGTLYANNKAFRGEKIFRKAMNLDEKLNSYNIQGGIVPEIMSMYGKAKHQRALHVGLNKTGKEAEQEEINLIRQTLKLSDEKMTDRDWRNLKDYVINTIDSRKEAFKSAGYELGTDLLGKNIPEHTMINLFWSYNDDANLKEEEDLILSSIQKIRNKMKKAAKDLPELEEKHFEIKRELAEKSIEETISSKLYGHLHNEKEELGEDFPEKGKEFQEKIKTFFGKRGKKPEEGKGIKSKARKKYFKSLGIKPNENNISTFENFYSNIKDKFIYDNENLRTWKQINKWRERVNNNFEKLNNNKAKLEDKISELEDYSNAKMTEELEGHAWLTHKVAMTPTEAKVIEMLKKSNYKSLYEDILIPTIKEVTGKDLNIKLHTDREISVFVPDKEYLIKNKGNIKSDALIDEGTIISSLPRTNRQRSNEPLKESFVELQQFQKSKLSEKEKQQQKKPKTYGEFKKRDFGNSNIYWTSYGADGFRHQPKFEKAPTRIKGEYRTKPKIIDFLKTPTRHDTKKLAELLTKGNERTWPGKRLEKGGTTTGNVLYIEHPDQSKEVMFFDDNFYEKIEEKYGEKIKASEEKISELEWKLKRARVTNSKRKLSQQLRREKNKLNDYYEEIRPDIKNIFLANDMHFGSETWPGRPSSSDATRASQLVALQSIGINNFSYSMITEALHGTLRFGSYDSKRTGHEEDPHSWELKMNYLTKKLTEKNIPAKKLLQYQYYFTKEQNDARPIFQQSQQKALFRDIAQPVFNELLERDIGIFIGAGNHWQGGERGKNDEGEIITNMFDRKYHDRGLIYQPPCEGNDFSFRPIKLPSNPGYDIQALMTHKMQSGKTEISKMINQAVGTKEEALFAITADRHHPGMVSEKNKFGVLDIGKQPMIEYANKIGKESSVRGTMTVGYGMNRELMYSGRYFLDNVVDPVIGWGNRVEILKKAHSMIEEEMKNASFAREKRRMDYLIEKNSK